MSRPPPRLFSLAVIQRAAVIYGVLAAVVTVPLLSGFRYSEETRRDTIRVRETGYMSVASQMILRAMSEPQASLRVLAQLPVVQSYVNSPVRENEGPMSRAFFAFCTAYERHERIRFVDPDGQEIVNVKAQEDGNVQFVPKEKLRRVADEPFFQIAEQNQGAEFAVSRMGELPASADMAAGLRHAVQVAKRVQDAQGRHRGFIVIDYDLGDLLLSLRGVGQSGGVAMLLDENGRILFDERHPNATVEAANASGTFSAQHPDAWKEVSRGGDGTLTEEEGMYLYSTLRPLGSAPAHQGHVANTSGAYAPEARQSADQSRWILVRWVPAASLDRTALIAQPVTRIVIGLVYFLLALCCGGFAHLSLQRRWEREIEREHATALEKQAYTDALTGIANRRYFVETAERYIARCRRSREPLCLLLLDIDLFKSVNDTYGHAAGDLVLKAFADVCRNALRESDVVARIGGEEFVVLFPDTPMANAILGAERIRASIESTLIPVTGTTLKITVSIGVAEFDTRKGNVDTLLNSADEALYRAKAAGRNRVFPEAP